MRFAHDDLSWPDYKPICYPDYKPLRYPDYKDVWCGFPTQAMEFPRSHDLPLGPFG